MKSYLQPSYEQYVPPDEFVRAAQWVLFDQPRPRHESLRQQTGLAVQLHQDNIKAVMTALDHIEQTYILESRDAVREFLLRHPSAISLLSDASNHLDAAFGLGSLKSVRLLIDDLGGSSVFGIVFWPESIASAEDALNNFDKNWWVDNCNRAAGVVNFNFELL